MGRIGEASGELAEELLRLREQNEINEGTYLSLVNLAQNVYNAATGKERRAREGESSIVIAADRIRERSDPYVQLLLKQSCVDAVKQAGAEDYGSMTFQELEEYLSRLAVRKAAERLGCVANGAEAHGGTVERATMEHIAATLGFAS